MKVFVLILISVALFHTRAEAWTETKCSNSDGTVKWEKGIDSDDVIHLKYTTFVEGTLSLDIKKVAIQFAKDIPLIERTFNTCQTMGKSRVYAGKVKIIASEKNPDVLRNYFPDNNVQAEVICTTITAVSSECSE